MSFTADNFSAGGAYSKAFARHVDVARRYDQLNKSDKLKVIAGSLLIDAITKTWSHFKDEERCKGFFLRLTKSEWGDKLLEMPYHKVYTDPPTVTATEKEKWRKIDREMAGGLTFLDESAVSHLNDPASIDAVTTMSKDDEFVVCSVIFGPSGKTVVHERLPWDKLELFGNLPVPDHAQGDLSREFDVDTLLSVVCGHCKKPEKSPAKFQACDKCKQVKYCSADCTEKHRDAHQESCFDLKEMRERELGK